MAKRFSRIGLFGAFVIGMAGVSAASCGSSSDSGINAQGGNQTDGGSCTTDPDCGSGRCISGACVVPRAAGATCTAWFECQSGVCQNGTCSPGGTQSDGSAGSTGSGGSTGTGGAGGNTTGSSCTTGSDCQSGQCIGGVCVAVNDAGGVTTTGPLFSGSGTGFRPLTAGCGPDTADQCTGTCEQAGGDPDVQIIRPPATLCFTGPGDPTPEDPLLVIEQSVETLDGQSYVHLRITFDPAFVDNTYGTGACCGWNRTHTFKDLVGSDHSELLVTNAAGDTVLNFKLDYISADTTSTCGYDALGVTGGEGQVLLGSADAILAATSSLDRDLNGCGYCESPACEGGDCRINSPTTDENYTPNPDSPRWDYRVVYEVWLDAATFGDPGFGQAYVTYVHASPSKLATNTIDIEPTPCPPDWGVPSGGDGGTTVCEPNYQIWISTEGASTCTPIPFANYPNMAACPDGYMLDLASEGQYCIPVP